MQRMNQNSSMKRPHGAVHQGDPNSAAAATTTAAAEQHPAKRLPYYQSQNGAVGGSYGPQQQPQYNSYARSTHPFSQQITGSAPNSLTRTSPPQTRSGGGDGGGGGGGGAAGPSSQQQQPPPQQMQPPIQPPQLDVVPCPLYAIPSSVVKVIHYTRNTVVTSSLQQNTWTEYLRIIDPAYDVQQIRHLRSTTHVCESYKGFTDDHIEKSSGLLVQMRKRIVADDRGRGLNDEIHFHSACNSSRMSSAPPVGVTRIHQMVYFAVGRRQFDLCTLYELPACDLRSLWTNQIKRHLKYRHNSVVAFTDAFPGLSRIGFTDLLCLSYDMINQALVGLYHVYTIKYVHGHVSTSSIICFGDVKGRSEFLASASAKIGDFKFVKPVYGATREEARHNEQNEMNDIRLLLVIPLLMYTLVMATISRPPPPPPMSTRAMMNPLSDPLSHIVKHMEAWDQSPLSSLTEAQKLQFERTKTQVKAFMTSILDEKIWSKLEAPIEVVTVGYMKHAGIAGNFVMFTHGVVKACLYLFSKYNLPSVHGNVGNVVALMKDDLSALCNGLTSLLKNLSKHATLADALAHVINTKPLDNIVTHTKSLQERCGL